MYMMEGLQRFGNLRRIAFVIGVFGALGIGPGEAHAAGDTGVVDASCRPAGEQSAQTEQTIAVDPTDPNNVLIGFISGLCVSHDGGVTWTRAVPTCTGDNNPAFDRSGMAYFECDINGVDYYTSNHANETSKDRNVAWSTHNAVGFFESNGDLVDRPWLVRGTGNQDLVVSWESFFSTPVGRVDLKVSTNGGATWIRRSRVDDMTDHPAMQDPRQVPVVGADRTIYVAYASGKGPFLDCRNCGALPTDYIVARSSDSGVTFTRSVAAANIARTDATAEQSEAICSLAADPNPARAQHLALAWSDERSGGSRILVVTSVDGGVHWSEPVDVTNDPQDRGIKKQDHPQIAFAPDGRLIIVWRDRSCCGTDWNVTYQIFARALTFDGFTGALTPGPTLQVTDGPQQPNSSNTKFDEYLGMSAGPEGVSVAWNQLRNVAGTTVASTTYRRISGDTFTDSDGDGVSDAADRCPNTPAGQPVDSSGCSASQRDGDGVPDDVDNCPVTPNPDQNDSDGNGIGDACDTTSTTGRMTGGGYVLTANGTKVTHGFTLRCVASEKPQDISVTWGNGNQFQLTSLITAACSDDPSLTQSPPAAPFDTFQGTGIGKFNGVYKATISFKFTDAGEPGSSDSMSIEIKDANGNSVCPLAVTFGEATITPTRIERVSPM